MNSLNFCSLFISKQASIKSIRKKNYKHFFRISFCNNSLFPYHPSFNTPWLKRAKSIFGFKQINSSILKGLSFSKYHQKSLRYCSVNPTYSSQNFENYKYKELTSFIKNSSNLQVLVIPLNHKLIRLVGEMSTLKRLSIILEDDFQDLKLIQKIRYRIQNLNNLVFLDLISNNSASLECLTCLYNETRAKYVGVSVNRTRTNDIMRFLTPKLLKLTISNSSSQTMIQVLRSWESFQNIQNLSIKRLEENLPEDFSFKDLKYLQNLPVLKELNLTVYLGSPEITQNLLKNLKLPRSLEHFCLWLSGVCLNDDVLSLKAYQNFGECLQQPKNLTSLPLLWDVKSGLDHLNTMMRYFPKNLSSIKTLRLYTCSSDYCLRACIDLPYIFSIIAPMRNLETLFINFEDISLIGDISCLGKINTIKYLYICSTTTKVASLYDYHRVMEFVKQNSGLRDLTFECSPDFLSKKEVNKLADVLKTLKSLEHLKLKIKVKDVLIDSFFALGEVMRGLRYLKERFIEITWQSMSSENFNESMCVKIFSPDWKFTMNRVSIYDERGKQLYRVRN